MGRIERVADVLVPVAVFVAVVTMCAVMAWSLIFGVRPARSFVDACERVHGTVAFDGRQYQCIKGADHGAP